MYISIYSQSSKIFEQLWRYPEEISNYKKITCLMFISLLVVFHIKDGLMGGYSSKKSQIYS